MPILVLSSTPSLNPPSPKSRSAPSCRRRTRTEACRSVDRTCLICSFCATDGKACRKDGWVDHLERRSSRRAKRTVLAKRLYRVFLYGWHVTSWTWRETGNGDQVISQSTANIMPGRRGARIHLFLPTTQALVETALSQLCRARPIWSTRYQTLNLVSRYFCFLASCSAEWAFYANHQRISTI